jgi:hypothetical protein
MLKEIKLKTLYLCRIEDGRAPKVYEAVVSAETPEKTWAWAYPTKSPTPTRGVSALREGAFTALEAAQAFIAERESQMAA